VRGRKGEREGRLQNAREGETGGGEGDERDTRTPLSLEIERERERDPLPSLREREGHFTALFSERPL
jgi:hypothetical protein